MTLLSADQKTPILSAVLIIKEFLMVASKTIYFGSLVNIVTASGKVQAASDSASEVFTGIALEGKTSGATGSTYIRVASLGAARLKTTLTVAQTHMGVKVVVLDSGNVTNAAGATNDIPVGIVIGIPTVGGSELDVQFSAGGALGAGGSA